MHQRRARTVSIILIAIAAIAGCGGPTPGVFVHQVYLATDVTAENVLVGRRESFTLLDPRMCIYLRFSNISPGDHEIRFEVYDPDGAQRWTHSRKFTVGYRNWIEWGWRPFNRTSDPPGSWKVDIYLDGNLLDSVRVRVDPVPDADLPEEPRRPEGVLDLLRQAI